MRIALLLCVLVACAHAPRGASVETLKSTAEDLHEKARWRDYRGVATLVTAERRSEFSQALSKGHDDRDLTITDFELLDARVSDDQLRGEVLTRMSWLRLPSVTEQSGEIRSKFTFQQGGWYLESLDGGPFAGYLPARADSPDLPAPSEAPRKKSRFD